MNIIRLLKENDVISKIKYYGSDDMATSFEVKNIIENSGLINNYLKNKNTIITNLDEYVDYLYFRCRVKYEEIINEVKEEFREDFKKQILKMKKIYKKYEIIDLLRFIKENYKEIFNEKFEGLYIKRDVIDYTIEFILLYCSNEKEIIEYVITNFSYKVYDNFDSFKKLFNNNLYYYDLLFTEDLIKKDMVYRLSKIKNVLLILMKRDLKKYNEKIDILVNIVKAENFNTSIEKVLGTYSTVETMKNILIELEHKNFYEFEKELKKQKKILDEYLEKNGHSIQYEISIKPIVEVYEDESKKWYEKSLIFTHSIDEKVKNKLISNFDYIIKYCEKSEIADLLFSNATYNEKFSYSIINNLSILMMRGKYSINYMIQDDNRLNDLLSYVFVGINNYFTEDSLYYNDKYLELDLNMLFNALREFKQASSEKNEMKVKWFVYAISNQLHGIIEKVLRDLYYEKIKENKYTNINSATLSFLLKKQEVKDVIGENNCNCIKYYLLNCDGIGKNLRNDFAHHNDDMYDKLVYDTILESIYLLLVISNTLLLKSMNC